MKKERRGKKELSNSIAISDGRGQTLSLQKRFVFQRFVNREEILKNENTAFTHALFQSLKENPSPLKRPTTPTEVLLEIVVLSPSCKKSTSTKKRKH